MQTPHITHKTLIETFNYENSTGIFRWAEKATKKALIGKVAGSFDNDGYRQIKINKRVYREHRLAWFYVYGEMPNGFLIDHRNGIKSDNRINNLRLSTPSENMRNQTKHFDGGSGFKGVTFNKTAKKWQAHCWANGKQNYLGVYLTPELASDVYISFAKKHHGSFFKI